MLAKFWELKLVVSRDIRIALISGLFSFFLGWLITHIYSSESRERAVEAARVEAAEAAREEGFKDGYSAGERAFEGTEEARLEEMFPGVFDGAREDAKKAGDAEGYRRGFAEGVKSKQDDVTNAAYDKGYQTGRAEGYSEGRRVGIAEGESQANRINLAEDDWRAYAVNVDGLRFLAETLEKNPDDREIQNALVGEATGLVSAANELKRSYEAQATSFNSLVQDLDKAIKSRNMPEMRRLAIALSSSLEIKGSTFLDGVKTQDATFDELSSRLQ